MKIFGLRIPPLFKSSGASIDSILARLEEGYRTSSGKSITPDNCLQSPTMQSIVTAVSRRIALTPIKVMHTKIKKGREVKEVLPNHPVARLLKKPNEWQTSVAFWLDATSYLIRYGNFVAFKSRGQTGPIKALIPINPGGITAEQGEDWQVSYKWRTGDGGSFSASASQVMHARDKSLNGFWGDSTVVQMREAIALEIQAEKMGGSVFGNNALPGLVFSFADSHQGFKSDVERKKFIEEFQSAYGTSGKRFSAMLLPKGINLANPVPIDNEKAQFLATRQYQRSVIAGAFGVPPHLVGDLSKGTFNNVEMQSLEFVFTVILPFVRIFETEMERSLLTDEDRSSGVIIRFNLESILRGDFKSRQEGLKIQREMGIINANEWREYENRNPISADDGGEMYWTRGPSGQGVEQPSSGGSAADDGPRGAGEEEGAEDESVDA